MRKYLVWLCVLALAVPSVLQAELKVPALSGRVVDRAGALSSGDRSKVEAAIRGFESATGGQMAVLIVPSLDGDALESFSMRVAEKWKLGYKGKDNGILLLVALKERKLRLEIGYGFEGQINDAKAGDIIRGMRSFFKAKRFGDGLVYAVTQAQEMITGKKASGAPVAPRHGSGGSSLPGGVIFMIVLFIILGNIFRGGRRGGFVLYSGGHSSGGGGFSSGGGFSGGGGGFGGGGASGGW